MSIFGKEYKPELCFAKFFFEHLVNGSSKFVICGWVVKIDPLVKNPDPLANTLVITDPSLLVSDFLPLE